jgi:hypothetical protein
MRWGWPSILLMVAGGASGPSLGNDALHTLAFMEGRYTGTVQIEGSVERSYPPVFHRAPVIVSVEPRAGGLSIRWLQGSDGYAAAVVGTIGPTTYSAPESFAGIDWECRPAAIPPFRSDPNAIVVKLLCFAPGEMHRPPVARLEIGNTLDRVSRRVTNTLIFDLHELVARDDRRETLRRSHGFLLRRVD